MKLNYLALSMWLGSEEAHAAVLQAWEQLVALESKGPEAMAAKILEMRGGSSGSSPFELPALYTVQEGVAVLKIDGPLVTGSAGFMRLFGVLGYDDIKVAAHEAMSLKNVKSMLMHIGSGGGSAAGAEENSLMLKQLGKIKPIHTYSDTVMGSAAYWAGSAGSHIGVAKTAQIGSVGVIMKHSEMSKMRQKEGITDTIIRAGEFKQLANPLEPLSEPAKVHLQGMAEDMYDVFADGVSTNLGVDRKKFDATMGRGREFLGMKAVEVGLAHATMSFEEAFALAKSVDKGNGTHQNSHIRKKDSTMKATLATQIMLALASGAAVASLDFTKAESTMEGVAPDAEAQTLLQAQAINVRAALDAGHAASLKAATEPLTAELNTLKATHATTTTELGALRITNASLVETTQKQAADLAASEKVLHASIGAMCVALGAADTSAELKGSALVAEHSRLETVFVSKFPKGRVSAITAEIDQTTKTEAGAELPNFALVARNLRASQAA